MSDASKRHAGDDESTVLESPAHAHFQRPDGAWYRLWITHTKPKTERGHAWHVHASYDRSGTLAPVAGTLWYLRPYGMANWDFDAPDEAVAAFRSKAQERFDHGYELRGGFVPD